jgi:hypothetical protein
MADPLITPSVGENAGGDQIGQTSGPTYGGEIGPQGYQQDMWQLDHIVGVFPPMDKGAAPGDFTGGTGGGGLGGQAEPMEPGGEMNSTVYERRGY